MPLLDSLRWLATAIPYPGPLAQKKTALCLAVKDEEAGTWEPCGNPACGGLKPRHRAREGWRFEGRSMCSEQCWSSMLRQRIERELIVRDTGGVVMHAHRVPLGLLLLSLGWITQEQLQSALAAQRRAGKGRIGDWLRKQTELTEREITRALGMQWSCPVFDLAAYRPRPADIPRELIEAYRILPLPARNRGVLYLAFDSGVDATASYAVQHVMGTRVEAGLARESAFAEVWAKILALEGRAATVVPVETGNEIYEAATTVLHTHDVADARLARLHQHLWLRVFHSKATGSSGNYRDYLYLLPPRASCSAH